jgi:hypothetical protein
VLRCVVCALRGAARHGAVWRGAATALLLRVARHPHLAHAQVPHCPHLGSKLLCRGGTLVD